MYENIIRLEDDLFEGWRWQESVGEHEFLSVHDCGIVELDISATFSNSEKVFVNKRGCNNSLVSEDLWNIGKRSYDRVCLALGGGFLDNDRLSKLIFLIKSTFIRRCQNLYGESIIFCKDDGSDFALEDLDGSSIAYNTMMVLWGCAGGWEEALVELGFNVMILQAIDDLAVVKLLESDDQEDAHQWIVMLHQQLRERELLSEGLTRHASKAAKARHAETDWIKEQVYQYYDQHKNEFKSVRAAAKAISKREPVAFRTIYDWLRERS